MGIGDEIMVTGHVREMQLKDPRKVRIAYERPTHWHPVFDNNPRIAGIAEKGDFQVYTPRVGGLRPYCAAKNESRWVWKEYKPLVGEFFFTNEERHFAQQLEQQSGPYMPRVVIEPNIKKSASPNKDWGLERWQRLATMLRDAGIGTFQFGPRGTDTLPGARLIHTNTFREAAAVLSLAKAAVLPEGGLHHAAAAVGVRSVVIYGGYISPKQTGYDMHTNIYTGGKPCGRRMTCLHCKEAMEKITPAQVFEELKKLLA